MIDLSTFEAWFVTGSQPLYGEEVLKHVADDAQKVAQGLSEAGTIPVRIVYKPVLTNPEAIRKLCAEANATDNCVGLITWMHTFSPAKMWIAGLQSLRKPFVHLHTQFNRDIPWSEIDMDFMNLNQSAHGGREFGFMCTRLRKARKVVVGHWRDLHVQDELGTWARAAAARQDARGAKVARFGDNMREVAVTEGDKVEAQIQLGYSVSGYGVGDLVERVQAAGEAEIDALLDEYEDRYDLPEPLRKGGSKRDSLREAAGIELGMRRFLEEGGFQAFTTTFENLHGLRQLPGLAVQRLMAEGYGFGAEGDWKTAAMVRALKVMGSGLDGGASFMEDYTYHLDPADSKVLGAHMLEVCESVAGGRCSVEIHPLDIGGKADPVRLVFDAAPGPAVNVTLVDMGNRFRMIVNEIEVTVAEEGLPKLPVARALWKPRPDLPTSAAAWILAGGAHHMGFSQAVRANVLEDFAEMVGVECVVIDSDTKLRQIKNELRWNAVYYGLSSRV